MFVTVTLNPAHDQTLTVATPLRPGGIHAIRRETRTPGGKGVNVAKMIAANGRPVTAGGLLGETDLPAYEAALAPLGVACRFLPAPHPTRTNVMITDGRGGEMKFNRPGFPDLAYDPEALAAYVRTLAEPRAPALAVLSGSLPARFPPGAYAALIRDFHAQGIPVALDASGPALAAGMEEHPEILKPNRRELEEALGRSLDSDRAVEEAIRGLLDRHEVVIVSDGPRGAWFGARGGVLFAPSPDVPVIDTTGAGDALLGQFVADYFPARALTVEGAARAVAAGAAAVEQPGTPPLALARVEALARSVTVKRVAP